MKLLLLSIVCLLLISCGKVNDNEKYIASVQVNDTLNINTDELVVKESTGEYTKYYFLYWESFAETGRAYYITTDKNNIVKAIWSKRR